MLNARITFGNVNKCSTEEEATTTPAATPTSSEENEEATGSKSATVFTTFLNYWNTCLQLLFFLFSSRQHCLHFRCSLPCLRCLSITTVEGAAATRQCPTTTRSFCSTPFIRVSWSLAETKARSEPASLLSNLLLSLFHALLDFCSSLHHCVFLCEHQAQALLFCHCRREAGIILMEKSQMQCPVARVTGRETGYSCH